MTEHTETKPRLLTIRKWSFAEEKTLLEKGEVEGRSEGACAIRRKLIAARRVGEGKDADEVAKECKVTVAEIMEQIKIETLKKEKRDGKREGAVQTVNSTPAKDIDDIIDSLKKLKKRVEASSS